MSLIKTKPEFYRLWETGILGNKPHTWNTLVEFQASDFNKRVAIRYREPKLLSGGPFIPNLKNGEVEMEMSKLVSEGWDPDTFQVIEQISPDTTTYLINGEVMRSARVGLYLRFSTANAMMRDALKKEDRSVCGITAITVLRHTLSPVDYDDLMMLLDMFPDHVVEFSGLDKQVGLFPNRKMIVWEVRQY